MATEIRSPYKAKAAARIISSSCRHVRLEAEVAAMRIECFRHKYHDITGKRPRVSAKSGLLRIKTGKWGSELRIYFDARDDIVRELDRLGFNVEKGQRPYNRKYRYRINNNRLWWELIRAGFKLGTNS